jgi:SET domain-containing protein
MKEINLEDTIDNLKNTYIQKSNVDGYGLFAHTKIDKNTILGYLDGQIIEWELHSKYNLTLEWNAIGNNKLLVRPYRTKYSYINHSREANLLIQYDPIRVIAKRDIVKDEELFLDYRLEPLSNEYIEKKGKFYL